MKLKKQIEENSQSLAQTTLVELMGVELTESEISEVSGGRWIEMTDTGSSCDGPIFVN